MTNPVQKVERPELLPCPFCGANPNLPELMRPKNGRTARPSWEIGCSQFCISMRRGSRRESIACWNKRDADREIAQLRSKPEDAEADKARLDWLDEIRPSLISHKESHGDGGWSYWWSVVRRKKAMGHPLGYIRPAIDQARAELAKHKESAK